MLSLPAPKPETPTLLLMSHLCTVFHELGHAIHNLCSRTKYGIAHFRDFIEIPSLMLEHWIWDPEVLTTIGMHYTCLGNSQRPADSLIGAVDCTIPRELIMAVCRTKNLHKAREVLIEVQRAIFDLIIHTPRNTMTATNIDTTFLWNGRREDVVGLPLGLAGESTGFAQAAFGHIFRAYDAGFFAYPL